MTVLVQMKAPGFTAPAIMPDNEINETFSLDDYKGRYVVLFFYPLDFTFVCPSEILAFDQKIAAFQDRQCEVLAVSVDSHYSHLAWKNTPVEEGGIGPIRYPMVADLTKEIAKNFGVLSDESVALRATFLIDREGIVRHQVVNDSDLGRNVDDVLRVLDALRHREQTGEVCPANWEKGKKAMQPTPAGVKRYLKEFDLRL